MSLNRRKFLKLVSAKLAITSSAALPLLSSTGCTHKRFYNPDQDIIIGGGRFKKNGEIRHVLAISNLQQRDTQFVNIDFLPHGIIIDPKNKERILAFEKNGTTAAAINLGDNAITNRITTDTGHIFSGHAAFNITGELIFDIEIDSDNANGKVVIRDSKTLQVVNTFPSYGKNPHQCKLIDQDKVIVVSNSGGYESQASITYIDTQTSKLLKTIKLDGNPVNSCHFDISDDGRLIVAAAPEHTNNPSSSESNDPLIETGDVRISNDDVLTTMTEPKVLTEKLFGEALSICIDEQHNIAAVTHPQANLLSFWSLNDSKLFKAMSVPNPRGITLTIDKKHYIVSYGIDTSSIMIRTKDLVANKESIMQPNYASGDHIINWSKTLTEIMPGKIYG